jgi:hypothetical protein
MDYSQTSHSLSLEAVVSPNTFSVSLYLTYGSSGVLTLNILSTQASEHAVLRVPFLSNSSLCDCQALVPSSPVLPVTWCLQDCHGILAVCLSGAFMSQGIQILALPGRVGEEPNWNAHQTSYNQKCTSVLNNCYGIHVYLRTIFTD